MEPGSTVKVEPMGELTILDIAGDLTILSEPSLKGAYGTAKDLGATKILLKFQTDAYINSGGIAVLIQLLAESRRNNQQVAIVGLSDHFKKIFSMVGITKFARIFDGVQEAQDALSRGA